MLKMKLNKLMLCVLAGVMVSGAALAADEPNQQRREQRREKMQNMTPEQRQQARANMEQRKEKRQGTPKG